MMNNDEYMMKITPIDQSRAHQKLVVIDDGRNQDEHGTAIVYWRVKEVQVN